MKLDELIQAELDGVATPEERARLAARLADDPAARVRHDGLRKVAAALENLPELDPPDDLRAAILARINGDLPRSETIIPFHRRILSAPVLRYAASFIVGMVIATLAHEIQVTGDGIRDSDRLAGTMAHGVDPARGPVARRANFGDSGIVGTLQLQRSDEYLVLALDLEADDPLGVIVPLAPGLRVVGVLGLGETSPDVQLDAERLALRLTGAQRVAVLLSGPAQAVPFQLYRQERLVHTDSLPVPER